LKEKWNDCDGQIEVDENVTQALRNANEFDKKETNIPPTYRSFNKL
jgi:hypothetical protein